MIERLRARLRLWFDFYDPRHGLLSLDRRRGALCGDLDCVCVKCTTYGCPCGERNRRASD